MHHRSNRRSRSERRKYNFELTKCAICPPSLSFSQVFFKIQIDPPLSFIFRNQTNSDGLKEREFHRLPDISSSFDWFRINRNHIDRTFPRVIFFFFTSKVNYVTTLTSRDVLERVAALITRSGSSSNGTTTRSSRRFDNFALEIQTDKRQQPWDGRAIVRGLRLSR